jgi:hypothetical protein
MAVILEFRVDESALAEDRRHDPAGADPAVVETTYFTMPVRFCVDHVDLLKTPSGVWLPQPLLGFATHLSLALHNLRSTGVAICSVADAGALHFQAHGERVRLVCDFNRAETEVAIDELDGAVRLFCQHVRDALRELVPELATHPSWSAWFPPN